MDTCGYGQVGDAMDGLSLKRTLLSGERRIGVWGTGYIGYSTMVNFAAAGVKCIGVDVNPSLVEAINQGEIPIPNLEFWLGFNPKPLVEMGMFEATTEWRRLLERDVAVHMVAVPTERGDRPWDGALRDVTGKIAGIDPEPGNPPLMIIESTLTPGKTDELVIPILESAGLKVGEDILVGVAPRRDWFISPDKNLKSLPRVVGGTTPETTGLMVEVLSLVCDKLLPAPDHRHAEIVKSIENAYRHVEITLANQLSLAYPDIDMVEVLKLVGTKWNIGTYHPSFGTGGYCIPLASQYLLSGTKRREQLSILEATVEYDRGMPYAVADSLVERGAEKVGILGLSYKGDLKVHILSPTLRIVERLREKGIHVKVHDPYYSEEEIKEITGVDAFKFPEGLGEFDTIVITAGHRIYKAIPEALLLRNLRNCRLILDNVEEAWRRFDFKPLGIEYHVAGDAGWLKGRGATQLVGRLG
jgi:nucleotide sugar dehydrogenase